MHRYRNHFMLQWYLLSRRAKNKYGGGDCYVELSHESMHALAHTQCIAIVGRQQGLSDVSFSSCRSSFKLSMDGENASFLGQSGKWPIFTVIYLLNPCCAAFCDVCSRVFIKYTKMSVFKQCKQQSFGIKWLRLNARFGLPANLTCVSRFKLLASWQFELHTCLWGAFQLISLFSWTRLMKDEYHCFISAGMCALLKTRAKTVFWKF